VALAGRAAGFAFGAVHTMTDVSTDAETKRLIVYFGLHTDDRRDPRYSAEDAELVQRFARVSGDDQAKAKAEIKSQVDENLRTDPRKDRSENTRLMLKVYINERVFGDIERRLKEALKVFEKWDGQTALTLPGSITIEIVKLGGGCQVVVTESGQQE
jgi:hypothetical protein